MPRWMYLGPNLRQPRNSPAEDRNRRSPLPAEVMSAKRPEVQLSRMVRAEPRELGEHTSSPGCSLQR